MSWFRKKKKEEVVDKKVSPDEAYRIMLEEKLYGKGSTTRLRQIKKDDKT